MKRVVIEPFEEEPFNADEVMDFVDNEISNRRLEETGLVTVSIEEVLPSDVQALKHFDELLRAAQAVWMTTQTGDLSVIEAYEIMVNDAGAYDGRGVNADDLVVVGRPEVDFLKSIIQKISDEAVEIIKAAKA